LSTPTGTELSVRSESVQRLYFLYLADRFDVNRRYQRKLVWSASEKQRLVDSILRDLPVPLFLVAEVRVSEDISYEVIDGLQRLNAIFSFIENEIPAINGEYFDLDALADTKSRRDKGELQQKTPVMSREKSVQFCNYSIAMSVFRALSGSVDEVFRRINSGGRRLSRQELRQAGTISPLANLVRIISSRIRGDTSPGDNVPLRVMPQLSITNYELDYGVNVDEIFWVRHGILRREDVRISLDEQVVLDVLIDCLVEPTPNTSSDARDEYYNFSNVIEEDAVPSTASTRISQAIETYGTNNLQNDVLRAWDVLRDVLDRRKARFATLVGVKRGGHSPRYFHAVFMAIFELMFKENMRVRDAELIGEKLVGITRGPLTIPGGSEWTREAKRSSFDAVKGVVRQAFEQGGETDDMGKYGWAWQLETILGNALVEQQLFDCKQGTLRLDAQRTFDANSFDKICRTVTAMSNTGRDSVGYLILGVADSESDTTRVVKLDSVEPQKYRRFTIVGLEREALVQNVTLNDYWTTLVQRIRDNPKLDARLSAKISSDARLAHYNGHAVGILKVTSVGDPCFYDGELYERSGSETRKVIQSDYVRIFGRFLSQR